MKMGRRAFGIGIAGGFLADPDRTLETRALRLEHQVTLAWPRLEGPERGLPLVVLLHGLGETSDEGLGARAWIDRYGLSSSVARLMSEGDPPYRGLAFACPALPRMGDAAIDGYVRWLVEALVPAARAELGGLVDGSPPRIAGCSYGGWASLEAVLRAPGAFGAWAGVQTAIGRASAEGYAARLARIGPRPLLVETSTLDPFHDASVALAGAANARGVACDLVVLPGPHDQPWLRRAGTPALLSWLDRH
jgi:hypothetical protein